MTSGTFSFKLVFPAHIQGYEIAKHFCMLKHAMSAMISTLHPKPCVHFNPFRKQGLLSEASNSSCSSYLLHPAGQIYGSALKKTAASCSISMGSSSLCKYGHGDDYDDEDFDISKWAMEVIETIMERAFRPPPKVSFMGRYLNHQSILLETDVDEAGNAPETLKEDLFPGNPDPPLTFSLEGTISAEKERPPKGWSIWDSTLEKERQLYVMTDSLNKRLMEQYWQQGRILPVFRDERLKCKMYPMFVRDNVSKQEMHLNFDQEIE